VASEQQTEGLKIDTDVSIVDKLNEDHAAVMLGGRFAIINHTTHPIFGTPDINFSSFQDFKHRYANQKVTRDDKLKSIADIWHESPRRKEYKGIVFEPSGNADGYYNLYQGLAVKPKKGNWGLYRQHLLQAIAGGNEKHAAWILKWMAHAVQKPGSEKPGTAIVLRGSQGTGKGFFVTCFGRIFGSHFVHLTNQPQLTGKFNNHLKAALLVFMDEGFWVGNKEAEGQIKGIITEKHMMVEPKGRDPFPVQNHMRVIVASNNDWAIPAGLEERRFAVFDVNPKYRSNQSFWGKAWKQMENGGTEAMLYDLMQMDVSDINDLRTIPRTDGLLDQITASMPPHQKFWLDRLVAGSQRKYEDSWNPVVSKDSLYDEYIAFAKDIGSHVKLDKTHFCKELRKLCPEVANSRPRNGGKQVPCFSFGADLETCRQFFQNLVDINIDWDKI